MTKYHDSDDHVFYEWGLVIFVWITLVALAGMGVWTYFLITCGHELAVGNAMMILMFSAIATFSLCNAIIMYKKMDWSFIYD